MKTLTIVTMSIFVFFFAGHTVNPLNVASVSTTEQAQSEMLNFNGCEHIDNRESYCGLKYQMCKDGYMESNGNFDYDSYHHDCNSIEEIQCKSHGYGGFWDYVLHHINFNIVF